MKRLFFIAVAFASLHANAKFAPIQESTLLTCNEVSDDVKRNGFEHFMTHGMPKLPHFATYVAGASWCDRDQDPVLTHIETADNPRCFVGYVCTARGQGD